MEAQEIPNFGWRVAFAGMGANRTALILAFLKPPAPLPEAEPVGQTQEQPAAAK
jgi:hypothetical protein